MKPKITVSRICSKPDCDKEIPKRRSKYCSQKCCILVNDLKYYYNNKDARLRYQKSYYEKTKERDKEKRKEYYKKWYAKNRDKHRGYMCKYMRTYKKDNEQRKQEDIPKV